MVLVLYKVVVVKVAVEVAAAAVVVISNILVRSFVYGWLPF